MTEGNRELVEKIFREAEFVRSLGIELAASGKGFCETRLNCVEAHRQQHGFIHAGVVMTLADHTCGGAAATTVPDGKDVITVENKVAFLRPAAGAKFTCRATVLKSGRNLVFVEGEVFAEGEKRVMVAKMSSTLAVIEKKV